MEKAGPRLANSDELSRRAPNGRVTGAPDDGQLKPLEYKQPLRRLMEMFDEPLPVKSLDHDSPGKARTRHSDTPPLVLGDRGGAGCSEASSEGAILLCTSQAVMI
jgi:hypothetical protein